MTLACVLLTIICSPRSTPGMKGRYRVGEATCNLRNAQSTPEERHQQNKRHSTETHSGRPRIQSEKRRGPRTLP